MSKLCIFAINMRIITKNILGLFFLFAFSVLSFCQGECAANFNCDLTVSKFKSGGGTTNRGFNGIDASNGGKIYCLSGADGGFDHSGYMQLKTDVIICIDQSSDGVPINITGNVSFNSGTPQVYVYGESVWSNVNIMNNTTEFNIQGTGDLTIDQSMQIQANSTFNNSGTLTFTENIELSNGVDINNYGTLELEKNITILNNSNSVITNTGNMTVTGSSDFRNGSSFLNSGNVTFTGTATMDDFDFTSSGNVDFDGTATIKNGTAIVSSGNMNFNNTTFSTNTTSITNSGNMSFFENADFKDGMTVSNSGDMTFEKDLALTNADVTNDNLIYVKGNMRGNNSSDFYNNSELIVDGNLDQDFKLYNYDRIEVGGDMDMEDYFDNRGGIYVDGDLELKPDQPNYFDNGFFVSNSLTFGGSASFGTGASTCALFISKQPVHNAGVSLTENAGTVAFISEGTVTDDGNNRYPDMDTLQEISLNLPANITDAEPTDFVDSRLQDYLEAGCAAHPLPIYLTSFYGTALNNSNLIQFTTGLELNNDYLLLQRSSDNQNWEDIKMFEGTGSSYSTKNYSFSDRDFNQNTYYRILQVDLDGSITLSQSIIVSRYNVDYFTYVSNGFYKIFAESRAEYTVSVFDLKGVKILEIDSPQEISLSQLPKGILIFKIDSTFTEKINNL